MLNNTIEKWVTIDNFPYYKISNLGKIKNSTDKVLQNLKQSQGYNAIELYHDKDHKRFLVHRLVALHFIPNTENKPYVNHIDGNKRNNAVSNLEWVTNSENIIHARETGLNPYNYPTAGKKLEGQRKGTSSYYGVAWDKARNKWRSAVRYNNKVYKQKRFNTEIEAAVHYNNLLDELNITDRPKNSI